MVRWIYLLALAGLLVTVQLYLDSQQNFEQGCLGVEASEVIDCGKVVNSEAGTFLGVSNIYWGMLFYAILALVSLVRVWIKKPELVRILQRITWGLIGVGFLYTLYLVYYQSFVLGTYCLLCLLSTIIVVSLTVVAYLEWKQQARSSSTKQIKETVTMRFFAGSTAVFALLLFAQVFWSTQVTAQQIPTKEGAPVGCSYDPNMQAVQNWYKLVGPDDLTIGNPRARVAVIEFLDPNCPHCKHLHPHIKQLIDTYKDQVRFYIKPMPIWQISVQQIEAIYLAGDQGKWQEMLDAQFEVQQSGGLSYEQLLDIARQIGLDVEAFKAGLESGKYRRKALINRQLARAVGINSVPKVLINGKPVLNQTGSLNYTCLSYLVGQELESRRP